MSELVLSKAYMAAMLETSNLDKITTLVEGHSFGELLTLFSVACGLERDNLSTKALPLVVLRSALNIKHGVAQREAYMRGRRDVEMALPHVLDLEAGAKWAAEAMDLWRSTPPLQGGE